MATKNIKSVSKTIEVALTAQEVNEAIKIKAGARKSSASSVLINADGSASVEFTIEK